MLLAHCGANWVACDVGSAVGFVVLFTVVGLVTLWPHGRVSHKGPLGPVRTLGAVAERVQRVPCALSTSHVCRVARVKLLDGPHPLRRRPVVFAAPQRARERLPGAGRPGPGKNLR